DQAAPAPAAPAADPDVCPFCGQRKDAQGQCACAISAQPAPSGATSGPRLIGSQGAYSANIFELTSDVTTLGREPDNSVPLPNDTTVSRHHARIALENGEYVAYDAGSSNGVFVNGEKITQRALRPGDEVQIGTTKFRFEV
ncbi:MAG: FHA domain-containing protein, partial [Sulfuricaulis sp.]|nr:FHA domain-containing protein [Sulfuricaulis sp.]